VGAQHHGLLPAQILDQRADLFELIGIKAAGGLIQDEHFGIVDHGLRQAHALAVAPAQLSDLLVLLTLKAHLTHHLLHALAQALQLVDAPHELEVLPHVHLQVQRVVLRQVTHAPAHVHAGLAHIEPAHRGVPTGLGYVAGEHLHHGALAGAVRAEETDHLPFADLERHAVQRLLGAVQLAHLADGDGHAAKVARAQSVKGEC